jgi:hypothetical protein
MGKRYPMNAISATSPNGKTMRSIRKSSLDCFPIFRHYTCRSSSVNGLDGSDTERDMAALLPGVFIQHLTFPSHMVSDPLGAEYSEGKAAMEIGGRSYLRRHLRTCAYSLT